MGFLLRSAIGLGAVYFAMFGQAQHAAEVASASNPCVLAANASLRGDSGVSAQWAAAGCAAKLSGHTQRIAQTLAAAAALSPPAPAPAAAPAPRPTPTAKPQNGTLTQADFQDPWFGPSRIQRKGGWRG